MQLGKLYGGVSTTVSLVGAYLMYRPSILIVTVVKFDHTLIMCGNFTFLMSQWEVYTVINFIFQMRK